ncbi:glycosyltransferase family 2 protein [candidate division KSB1 bacterium]|nr:glycosyltransferase family 2 protein [candidate division KSB1 bacterium]NIR72961.1 glycosyltransferase family 2 protein [candidate division KSB1 bacterium]NIS25178.1 glycosyltransferase family 2 protein [candidate division KSB1 bacterium]NIT72081.1 glycosyltransferase family 2 protein [candidate division KSB1 bacterium]NIU25881.1 glycosyltransferase family 2 protein [candidate division KSB1 bacterium]
MYKNRRILLLTAAYNEERKIGEVVRRVPQNIVDKIIVVDDGSTDRTAEIARNGGARVISLGACMGVGFAARVGFEEAQKNGFDVVVTIAGNNKDNPEEIPRLLDPICDDDYDFVMGSRFMDGGEYGGDMQFYRKLATRLHPWLLGFFCSKRLTESTNGFRAMKTVILQDKRINLYQSWLNHYELEVYLLMKILKLGYNTKEVPCTKIYPPKKIGRTKMRPLLDWWKMLRPIFLVGFGIRD